MIVGICVSVQVQKYVCMLKYSFDWGVRVMQNSQNYFLTTLGYSKFRCNCIRCTSRSEKSGEFLTTLWDFHTNRCIVYNVNIFVETVSCVFEGIFMLGGSKCSK